jgi:hypothetical protein
MMNQLADELGLLKLVRKDAVSGHSANRQASDSPSDTVTSQSNPENNLNKEEIRLLVKILKAMGHTCEHQHITIQQGITHYNFNGTTLVFDDVNKADENAVIHLSPLSTMLNDPSQKRPTWEKLKTLQNG